MKIKSIKLGNIRSFGKLTSSNAIRFDTDGMNLIVGPNASGKSNLMGAIMRLLSETLSRPQPAIQPIQLIQRATANTQLITQNVDTRLYISDMMVKNHKVDQSELRQVELEVIFEESDIANLEMIRKNLKVLSAISDRYYVDTNPNKYSELYNKINRRLPKAGAVQKIRLIESRLEIERRKFFETQGPETTAALYLRAYRMVAAAIDIHNELLIPQTYKDQERGDPRAYNLAAALRDVFMEPTRQQLPQLYPFATLMSVEERLLQIDPGATVFGQSGQTRIGRTRIISDSLSNKTTGGNVTTAVSDIFEQLKVRIVTDALEMLTGPIDLQTVLDNINKNDESLRAINNYLEWFSLSIQFGNLRPADGTAQFELLENDAIVRFDELSSGQRSIVNIAATLAFSRESGGVVLIDEIENHLHPTMQIRLREAIMSNLSNRVQVIAVTHSPAMMDEKNLAATHRVAIEEGFSRIRSCDSLKDDKTTVRMLFASTNGGAIFFANSVLLVEGPSDGMFFRTYNKDLYPTSELLIYETTTSGKITPTIDVLKKLGIKYTAVVDLDYAARIPRPVINSVNGKTKDLVRSDFSAKDIVKIDKRRKKLATNKIFVLSEGTIESYTHTSTSSRQKTASMLDFVTKKDWSKISNKNEIDGYLTSANKAG